VNIAHTVVVVDSEQSLPFVTSFPNFPQCFFAGGGTSGPGGVTLCQMRIYLLETLINTEIRGKKA